MNEDIRDFLEQLAREMPPRQTVPERMLRRARRAVTLTVVSSLLLLALAGAGAFAGVKAIRIPASQPLSATTEASPSASASTTPGVAPSPSPCPTPTSVPIGPRASSMPVSLKKAEELLGFPIPRPGDLLASDFTLTSTAILGNEEVVLDYSSGIEVTVSRKGALSRGELEVLAKELGLDIRRAVRTIDGQPALVIPACAHGQGNPGSVEIQVDSATVTIYGHYDSEALVRVAETVGVRP